MSDPLQIFGVTLLGFTAENGRRLLLTVLFVAAGVLIGRALHWGVSRLLRNIKSRRGAFWGGQIVNIAVAALVILGVLSIWFEDPGRLATAAGLLTAGLAFALQRVITATAGYFVILRGDTFNVGDRIVMGGVRGDVVALSFMQTTILEMGEASTGTTPAGSGSWVRSRQYTGRVVTVSNAKIFDEPVYNFTRDFPYIWEEISVPIRYDADRGRAENVLLAAARQHTASIMSLGADDAAELQRRFGLPSTEIRPRVYLRITHHWLEMTVRFLARTHGVRELKDAISRDILGGLDAAGITIATETYTVSGTALPRTQEERQGGSD
ncbi:MAG TPA: mechanosensitive ion channel domain-containing protein [Microvirga sp.]|nr:mechanosensitive ion channel domain-containing protein [Microvirga sp.]